MNADGLQVRALRHAYGPTVVLDGVDLAVPAAQARPELEFFFAQLHARDPALLGGKLPDAGFFGT